MKSDDKEKPLTLYASERHIESEEKKRRNMDKARRNWRLIAALVAALILWAAYVHGLNDGRAYMAEIACRN